MPDYQPPRDFLEVLRDIDYEEALDPSNPRRVDTQEARGSQRTLTRLARKLGMELHNERFRPSARKHILFFGHVGGGKSTELKFYAAHLNKTRCFFPVEVDVDAVLDRNNLQYADLVMAMANELLAALQRDKIELLPSAFDDLQNWFTQKVVTRAEVREFATEITAGAQAEAGLPLLGKLFARFSAAFRANATYKDELRHVIRNTFTQLAEAFDRLIDGAEAALARRRGVDVVRVLFIVDGTDRLKQEDRVRFFVQDAELLLAVQTFAVYTAPIALKYDGGLAGKLDADLVLPMVMLQDESGARFEPGWRAMTDILLRRADRSLFASEADVERLVEHSGGHPRDLLRLLQYACEFAETRIDAGVVGQAIAQLASEYRRLLRPDDYPRLVQIDRAPQDVGNDQRTCELLYNCALLEYNNGSWRRCHPVIRTLEGYRRAADTPPAAA